MRYLKYISETVKEDVERDLVSIANDSLVYLMDEGYQVWSSCQRWGKSNKSTTFLNMCKKDTSKTFKWEDIKEDYITFIHYISEKYEVESVQTTLVTYVPPGQLSTGSGFKSKEYKINDVINDSIDDNSEMTQINLYVKVLF